MTADATRQLLPRDQRRAQLMRAAAAAFSDAGFAATSMDDVAKAAGITKLIVYRHFLSKEELYRAILEETADRLAQEWIGFTDTEHSEGAAVRTLLTVAREHPDGFRLLFVHASREPEFSAYQADFRALQLDVADRLVGSAIADPVMRRWATNIVIDHLVSSVLTWLDQESPARDDEFVEVATSTLAAVVRATVTSQRPRSVTVLKGEFAV